MFVRLFLGAAIALAVPAFFGSGALLGQEPDSPKTKGAAKADHEPQEAATGDVHAAGGQDAHGADAAHDPYDNSHKNMSNSLTNPVAIKSDSAIFTFIVFVIILLILTKFAWKPISHGLEMREKGIADKIEQARLAADQASEQLRQYEAKLAAATEEAQQIVAKARQDAQAAHERIVSEASAAAQKERERAVADIGAAKNQALREIAERSVDTAISLARQVIRREVRPADHEQLIQDALAQFPKATRLN